MLEALEQRPTDPYILIRLGMVHRRMGDEPTARGYFEQALEMVAPFVSGETINEDQAAYAVVLAWAHAGLGNVEEAVRVADIMLAFRSDDRFTRPRNVIGGAAKVYAWVGETDRALDVIEEALSTPVQLGAGWTWGVSGPGFRLDPDWDELRGNPRFEALIARLEDGGEHY